MSEETNKPKARPPKQTTALRYVGLSTQMGVTIAAFSVGGYYLDKALGTKPYFTAGLALAGVALALYVVLKEVLREKP